MLCALLITSAPAQAGTIGLADMTRTAVDARNMRPASELRLRVASQNAQVAAGTQSPQNGGTSSSDQSNGTDTATPQVGTVTASTGATLTQGGGSGGQVETVDLGDVTGTVCDCGEIPIERIPGKAFPKWPFLALAGIPLAFIHRGDNPSPPDTPPNAPPPPPSVPEPATLFLFGSGLLALGTRARRRHGRKQAELQAVAQTLVATEEV